MLLGYAKLSKIPFFMTAHLWVIYYVNSYIFFEEVNSNYSIFKKDFSILHDAAISSVKKFVKVTHEPPMALAFAGFLSFSFEIELLIVSVINHSLALLAGYWTIHNHTQPILQQIGSILGPFAKFKVGKLQQELGYLAVCLVFSFHIHYWWNCARILSRLTGRRQTFNIDPWTVRRVKTYGEKIHDAYDYVKGEAAHLGHVAADSALHAGHVAADGAKVAYKATKKGAHDVMEGVKHVTEDAKHMLDKKKK